MFKRSRSRPQHPRLHPLQPQTYPSRQEPPRNLQSTATSPPQHGDQRRHPSRHRVHLAPATPLTRPQAVDSSLSPRPSSHRVHSPPRNDHVVSQPLLRLPSDNHHRTLRSLHLVNLPSQRPFRATRPGPCLKVSFLHASSRKARRRCPWTP